MNRYFYSVLSASTFFAVSFGVEYGRQLYRQLSSEHERLVVVHADGTIEPASSGLDFWTHYTELAFVVLVICFLSFLFVSALVSRWFKPKTVKLTVVSGALAAAIPVVFMHTEMFSYGCVFPESSLNPLLGYSLLGIVSGVAAMLLLKASGWLGRRLK